MIGLVLLLSAWLAAGCTPEVRTPARVATTTGPSTTGGTPSASAPGEDRAALDEVGVRRCRAALQRAWRAGDPTRAGRLGAEAAGRRLAVIARNLHRLAPVDLTLTGDPASGDPTSNVLWWRLVGDPDRVPTQVVIRWQAGPRCVASVVPRGQTPIWMTRPVRVLTTPRVRVVLDRRAPGAAVVASARDALGAVRRVLPHWAGTLSVEVPADPADYAAELDVPVGEHSGDAAVTTTLGDPATSATTRVVVNPEVFPGLSPLGARVVVAHEATHVATHAAASPLPLWLVEGFADYVALRQVRVSVRRSAAELIAQIRVDGVPRRPPAAADFEAGGARGQAAYQAAWLLCRSIARHHGERQLVAFYRRAEQLGTVRDRMSVGPGCTVACEIARWRAQLARLSRPQ